MKRHHLIALLIACFALSGSPVFAADMLAPFEKSDRKFGFVNSDHCWVINPQFDGALSFSDDVFHGLAHDRPARDIGLAAVKLGGKWGFIDRTGKTVINPQFDVAGIFSDGLAGVKLGGNWGFIDPKGKMVIEPKFDDASSFRDRLAVVELGGKFVYIDLTGQVLLDPTCTAKRGEDGDSLMDKVRGWFSK